MPTYIKRIRTVVFVRIPTIQTKLKRIENMTHRILLLLLVLCVHFTHSSVVFQKPSDQTQQEDFGSYFVTMNASETGENPIVFTASVSDSNILSLVGFDGRNLFFQSKPDAIGAVIVSVTASSSGSSVIQPFFFTVLPVNDAPVVSNARDTQGRVFVQNPENQSNAVDLNATDVENDQNLTFEIVGGDDAASFSIDAGSGQLSFQSSPDFESLGDADSNGSYEVLVQVRDDQAISPSVLVVVELTNVDEPPKLQPLNALSLNEDFGTTSIALVLSDPENDPIELTVLSSNSNIVQVVSSNQNQVVLSSVPNNFGFVTILVAADSSGGSTSSNLEIQVTSKNDNPVASAGPDLNINYSPTYLHLNASASDIDGTVDSIQWTQLSGPQIEILFANQIRPEFVLPFVAGQNLDIVLRLTVTDNDGATHSDDIRFIFQVPQSPLVVEAMQAIDRVVGVPSGKITSYTKVSQSQVNFKIQSMPYNIESFKGEQGWHISFISSEPASFNLSASYPVLASLMGGVAFEDIAFIISEVGESLDASVLSSGESNLYSTYLSEGALELATGITFLSALNPGEGNFKSVCELLLKGKLAPGLLKFSGKLDKEVLTGIIQGAVEDEATPDTGDAESDDSFLASLDETEEDSSKLLDFSLELPPISPFPFSTTNDKSKLHVEYEPTTFNIEVSDADEIGASATRETHVWFVDHQETVDCTITLNFEGPEFTEATIEGESSVNWADSLGINIPDFEIRKLLFSGTLTPAGGDEEEEEDGVSEGETAEPSDGDSSEDASEQIDLGLGLGLEMAIFQQPAFQAIFGMNLSGGQIEEVSLSFQSADEGSAGLDLKKVPGIREIPIMSELTLGPLTLGYNLQSKDYYFTSQATWTSKGITGAFGLMTNDNEPTVLLRVDDLYLNDIVDDLPETFENLGFATAAIAVSKSDQSGVSAEDLPGGIGDLLAGIVDEGGGNVPITDGVTVMTALHMDNLPVPIQDAFSLFGFTKESFKEMGAQDDKLVLAGSVGGVFGGEPSAALSVILPTIKLPAAFSDNSPIGEIVKFNDVQGSFFIRYYSVNQALEIGLAGLMNIDVPRVDDATKVDNLDVEGSVFVQNSPTAGAGFAVRGKVGGLWNEPFGLQDISFKDTVLQLGADATGAVKFGIAGDFTFETSTGQTRTYVFGNGTDVLLSTGVPVIKTFAISLKGPQLTSRTKSEIEDALLRAFITSPAMETTIKAALGEGSERDAFDFFSTNLKNKTLSEIMESDKLPMDVLRYRDFELYFATPGGEIPGRDDLNLGMGFVVEGDIELVTPHKTYLLANSKSRLTMGSGLDISGKITNINLGPLQVNSPSLRVRMGIPIIHGAGFPYFSLQGGANVLGFGKTLDIFLEQNRIRTQFSESWGTFGKTYFTLTSVGGEQLLPDDFLVSASFGGFNTTLPSLSRSTVFPVRSVKKVSAIASSRIKNGMVEHAKWIEGKSKKNKDYTNKKRKKAKKRTKKQMRKKKQLKKKRDKSKKKLKSAKKKHKKALKRKKKTLKNKKKKRSKKTDFVRKNSKSTHKSMIRRSDGFIGFWQDVGKGIEDTANEVGDGVVDAAEEVEEAAEEVAEEVEEVVDEAAAEAEKLAKEAEKLAKEAERALTKLVNAAKKLIKELDKEIKKLTKEIDRLATKHLKVELGLSKAIDKAKKLLAKAGSQLSKLKNIEKLANSIYRQAENTYNAVRGAVKSIENGDSFEVRDISVRDFPLRGNGKIKVNVNLALLGQTVKETVSLNKSGPEDIFPIIKSRMTKIMSNFESNSAKSYQRVARSYSINAIVPKNDNFSNAIDLSGLEGTTSAVNLLATTEVGELEHDDLETLKTVWWSYVASSDGFLEFNTIGSSFDTVLAAYSGNSLNQLKLIASNSDSTDASSQLTQTSKICFEVQAGQKYKIVVGGMDEDEGQIQLNFKAVTQTRIQNDNFDNAEVLSSDSGIVNSRIAEATTEEFEPDHQLAGAQRSIWFQWTPSQSMLASIDTSGSGFDTRLSVYRGNTLTSIVELAANDDSFEDGTSRVIVPVQANETIYIVVMSMDNGESIQLNYSSNQKQPVQYAFFETPWDISGRSGTYTGSNVDAFNQASESGEGSKSLWWKWRSDFDGSLSVNTQGTLIDTLLNVFVGSSLSNLQPIASNDNDESVEAALTSRVIFPVRVNQDYYFRVASLDGEESSQVILSYNTSDLAISLINDDFQNAVHLESNEGILSVDPSYATTELGEPDVVLGEGTLWYKFISFQDGLLNLKTSGSNSGGAGIDVFTGENLQTLIRVAGSQLENNGDYKARLDAKASQVYYIRLRNRENEGILNFSYSLEAIVRPVNDLIANAKVIQNLTGQESSNNFLALAEDGEPEHALQKASSSVWYLFTAPRDGWYKFEGNSNFNANLVAYQGSSLTNLVSLASAEFRLNDLDDVSLSELELASEGLAADSDSEGNILIKLGQFDSIYLVVDGISNAQGNFDLKWNHLDDLKPVNDDFSEAKVISALDEIQEANNQFATLQINEPSHGDLPLDKSMWYVWNPTQAEVGLIDVTLKDSRFNSVLAVYRGTSIDSLETVAVGDGHVTTEEGLANIQNLVRFQAFSGQSYHIAVGGFDRDYGDFDLQLKKSTIQLVENDFFLQSTELTGEVFSIYGSTIGASKELAEFDHGGVQAGASVWYRWTAVKDSFLELYVDEVDDQITLAVYRMKTSTTIVEIVADENGRVVVKALKDREYHFVVASQEGRQENFRLKGQTLDLTAPSNDDYAAAKTLAGVLLSESVPMDLSSLEDDEPTHLSDATISGSAWFKWQAPESGLLGLTMTSNYNGGLAVYEGGQLTQLRLLSGLSPLSSIDSYENEEDQFVETFVESGKVYSIAVTVSSDMAYLDYGRSSEIELSFTPTLPVANAGSDLEVVEGQTVYLIGALSTDPDGIIESFLWTQKDGQPLININDANQTIANFSAPQIDADTEFVFELEVTDDRGTNATDTMRVKVLNEYKPPVTLAGPNLVVSYDRLIELDGSKSLNSAGGSLSYQWSQIRGEALKISKATSSIAQVNISTTTSGGFVFELETTNDFGLKSRDRVIMNPVSESIIPQAVIHASEMVSPSSRVELDASRSLDYDSEVLTYQWRQLNGPSVDLQGASLSLASFQAPAGYQGSLEFELLVIDDSGLMDSQRVTIHVSEGPLPPVADAGPDQFIHTGAEVELNGLLSYDQGTGIKSSQWKLVRQIGGARLSYNPNLAVQTLHLPESEGQWVFELSVTNNDGLTKHDEVLISTSPNILDSIKETIQLGVSAQEEVELGLSAVIEGDSIVYWEQTSGTKLPISDPSAYNPTIDTLGYSTGGSVSFSIFVRRQEGFQFSKEVTLNVVPVGQQIPVANAGVNFSIGTGKVGTLKAGSVTSDVSYRWVQQSGPTVLLSDSNSSQTLFISPRNLTVQQTLKFQLEVLNSSGFKAVDSVEVLVIPTSNKVFATDVLEIAPLRAGAESKIGISYDLGSMSNLVSAKQVNPSTDSQISQLGSAPVSNDKLIEFSVKTSGVTSANITVHLAEAVPAGHVWWKFSRSRNQWLTFPDDKVQFSADRKRVLINIEDNSAYDDDFRSGEIKDPSGPGAPNNSIFDPSQINSGALGGGGGGGCFVATAAFGDYDHPLVLILRNFRDKILLRNEIGREFVQFYYRYSPSLANWISNSLVTRVVSGVLLLPLILISLILLYPLWGWLFLLLQLGLLLHLLSRRRMASKY